ncbi:hypothetical protein ARMGADRAFT_307736 [Armillaria gallica]|nr:hypothetical protein ARMGADRAFT_307736 [Armillaria gallica]
MLTLVGVCRYSICCTYTFHHIGFRFSLYAWTTRSLNQFIIHYNMHIKVHRYRIRYLFNYPPLCYYSCVIDLRTALYIAQM